MGGGALISLSLWAGSAQALTFNSAPGPYFFDPSIGTTTAAPALAIPITVSGAGTVTSIDSVILNGMIVNSWAGEVGIWLRSPTGTEVELVRRGITGFNFSGYGGCPTGNGSFCRINGNITLSASGVNPNTVGVDPLPTGNYNPGGLFAGVSAFNGQNADGIWQLLVLDTNFDGPHTINSVTLNLTGTPVAVPYEFESATGIAILGLGYGLKKWRKRRQQKRGVLSQSSPPDSNHSTSPPLEILELLETQVSPETEAEEKELVKSA